MGSSSEPGDRSESLGALRARHRLEPLTHHMLAPGPCKRLVIHLNADTSSGKDFLFREILTFLFDRGVAGATVIRPEAGFGSHHRLHDQQADGVAGLHVPIRIEFLESAEKLSMLLPELLQMVSDGVVEVQDTTILKAAVS